MLLKNTSLQKVSLKGRAISSHPSFVISSRAFLRMHLFSLVYKVCTLSHMELQFICAGFVTQKIIKLVFDRKEVEPAV